jgi:membrane protein DedA with SNARE-associated domain
LEALFLEWLKEYGYPILFVWSIMEGELGLIMAGLMSHTGDMNLYLSIVVAAMGGFVGDQIYFWIGRYNRGYVQKELIEHRRKFALATLLLRKHGWPIIFLQRYMYGMRTILPIAIGTPKLSAKKFAFINFISAFVWASLTIIPTYIFGDVILQFLNYAKSHWYIFLPFALTVAFSIIWYFKRFGEKKHKKIL